MRARPLRLPLGCVLLLLATLRGAAHCGAAHNFLVRALRSFPGPLSFCVPVRRFFKRASQLVPRKCVHFAPGFVIALSVLVPWRDLVRRSRSVVRGGGRGARWGAQVAPPAVPRARLVSLLLSRGVLPLSPPPPSPAGGRGGARLVRGWDRSRRRPSALHASSRAGAGAQVNKGRLPRNFRLDKSERTCYYTGARLVSGPWAPAFEQSVTLGESVVRKGGAFFGPFSARKREIFRRSLPGSGMPGSQHNQPGKIPV